VSEDEQKKRDALERIRKSPKRAAAMGLLSGMFASLGVEHDVEDADVDDFLVALVSRNAPGETVAVHHLQLYIIMCKAFIGPALRRLAAAGRIRAITESDGTTAYLPAKESMQ